MATAALRNTKRERLNRDVNGLVKKIRSKHKGAGNRKDITFEELLADTLLLSFVIREGLPYPVFESIRQLSPFSEKDWSVLLDLSTKSLQRYKDSSAVLKPIYAEKILEMAEVTQLGTEVFASLEKFSLWLHSPSFALGNVTPIELLRDSYGKELVVGELTRIKYGILS